MHKPPDQNRIVPSVCSTGNRIIPSRRAGLSPVRSLRQRRARQEAGEVVVSGQSSVVPPRGLDLVDRAKACDSAKETALRTGRL